MNRRSLLAWLALPAGSAQARDTDPEAGEWNFAVTLDGTPIGRHRFTVAGTPAARTVDSRAQFVVRILGIPVYRYRHHAREQWEGDCLRALDAETDDDGHVRKVARRYESACRMSFAYWNARLVTQRELVDPQTGEAAPVRFERLPDAPIEVGGRPVPARGWSLLAPPQRITVWYAAGSGRWIALDAQARGGRQLSYRLPPEEPRS